MVLALGIVASSALVLSGCGKDGEKKQEENVVKIEEIVGNYEGVVKQTIKDVKVTPAEKKDEVMKDLQSDFKAEEREAFKLEKNPLDPKGVVIKDDDFTITFKDALSVENGVLFNIADFKYVEKTGSGKEEGKLTFKKGRSLYYLEVNGKKTATYDALYNKAAKSFNYALDVVLQYKNEIEGKKVEVSATIEVEFEGKKK